MEPIEPEEYVFINDKEFFEYLIPRLVAHVKEMAKKYPDSDWALIAPTIHVLSDSKLPIVVMSLRRNMRATLDVVVGGQTRFDVNDLDALREWVYVTEYEAEADGGLNLSEDYLLGVGFINSYTDAEDQNDPYNNRLATLVTEYLDANTRRCSYAVCMSNVGKVVRERIIDLPALVGNRWLFLQAVEATLQKAAVYNIQHQYEHAYITHKPIVMKPVVFVVADSDAVEG